MINTGDVKKTFLQFEVQIMFGRQGKDVVNSSGVIAVVGMGGYSYIIHVNTDGNTQEFVLSYNRVEDMIHHHLKGSGGVGETKKHNCRFIEAITCFESGLVFITFLDTDVVVPLADVQFCIDVGAAQVSDKVCDERKWILIPYSVVVDVSIVSNRTWLSVLLGNEKERRGVLGF